MTNNKDISLEGLQLKKLELMKQRLELEHRNIHWAKYMHLNTKNQRMTFKNRQFLIDIYKAIHSETSVIIQKSVQCGVSEAFILSHLEQAERGLSILYILPTVEVRNRFVHNRIDRTLIKVPLYREILAKSTLSVDSVMLKMFGSGSINYVASKSPASFTEYPADAIYYDEKDRMDQEVILLAKDRLSDSSYKFERIVSNPTIGEYGISYDYENSSKAKWLFKCPHCNERQPYDMFANVVVEIGKREYETIDKEYKRGDNKKTDVNVYCAKCHKPIDRFGVEAEWVHEFPENEARGFHISKLFSPQGTIRELVDRLFDSRSNETKMQAFLNSDLGLPMSGGGSQITRENVVDTRGDYRLGGLEKIGVRYAGVDVGNDLHTIVREMVNGKKKLIFKGKLKSEQDVLKLMTDFSVQVLVIDAEPELRMVENLKDASNKIYNCFFGRVKETDMNKSSKTITIRRTLVVDRVKENYDRMIYLNPSNILDDKEYLDHMQSNVRVADLDGGEFVWLQKAKRPDHYLFAEAYADLACELAVGSDIFRAYEDINKTTTARDATEATPESKVDDDMDRLPQAEQERLKSKQAMNANEFFTQISGGIMQQ